METLQEAIDVIARHYTFTADAYPELAHANLEQVHAFGVRHSALHIAKSMGRIATVAEALDHGNARDNALLNEAIIKLLINTLRLAELQNLSAKDLLTKIPGALR